jgi:outer membrane usher protein
MRHPLRLAVMLALAGSAPAVAATPEAFVPTVVELRLNGQSEGTTLVVRRDAEGSLLLRTADLAVLRLRMPSQGLMTIDGERYVRLGADTGAAVTFDEAAQAVEVTLPPSAFLPTAGRAGSPDVPQVTRAGLGGFLNYDLSGQRVGDQRDLGAILDAGAYGPYGVVTSSLLGRHDGTGGEVVRLESTWTLDLPERLATLRVGDAISVSGAWGRSVRFGGLQFGTNFATQPTLVTTPLLYAQGAAVVPSTVDVFVNGQRVASESVPPGPFTIDRVPPVTGAGQMQVVITDALGRQQVLAQPYYTGPSLLRAGLNEHSLEIGAIREDYGLRSNVYGDLVFAATFRRGLTDRFTAELHAEGEADGPRALGVDTALQIGTVGILSLTTAAGGEDELGWLAGIGFERSARRVSVLARTQYTTETFAQLGSAAQAGRPRQRSFGSLGFGLGRLGNLQVFYGLQSYWSGPASETAGLSHSITLGTLGYLSLIASHTAAEDSSTDVFLNWTVPFGDRRTAALGVRHTGGAAYVEPFEAMASLQQSLPAGAGTGYFVALSSGTDAQLDYTVQGDAGVAGVQYARRNDEDGWRVNASGGIALTGAGVLPARRLDRSFAVVQLEDFPGMTVYLENQPIGRTDRKGRVLVDALRPYERNTISIDPTELPLDASLATSTITVAPAYRSGPVLRFPVARASAATLRLVQPDGSPVPAGARVTTPHEQAPVALDGLVFLTVAAGRQQAAAEWGNQRCTFSFERPTGGDPQPDLGRITCRPAGGGQGTPGDGS